MRFLLLGFLFALILAVSAHPTPDDSSDLDIDLIYDNDRNTTEHASLEARGKDKPKHDIHCTSKGLGDQKNLKEAMKWLRQERNKDKKPFLNAGRCQTAACYKDAKIRWCNDWDYIAEGAHVILDECKDRKKYSAGWLGHNDAWRVLVEKEDCYRQPGPEWWGYSD
ncbi:hypothetical protein BJY04DRAFT_217457 [Aspergillus karnatakaensis]|uniref:uncharacterized protein n=1 Tax=Aspergillus karnatakaensis TaxID=1810916 RepID=UPI003CCCE4FB